MQRRGGTVSKKIKSVKSIVGNTTLFFFNPSLSLTVVNVRIVRQRVRFRPCIVEHGTPVKGLEICQIIGVYYRRSLEPRETEMFLEESM